MKHEGHEGHNESNKKEKNVVDSEAFTDIEVLRILRGFVVNLFGWRGVGSVTSVPSVALW